MPLPDDQQWHWTEGNKYAVEGIKTLLLLNGGAALALLAFLGNRDKEASHASDIASAAGNALLVFGLGALVSGLAFFCAYLTQLMYGNRTHSHATLWHNLTYLVIAVAVALFVCGIFFARSAVLANLG
jgi:Mn2+/Fe2+ NRAMP family transporter